MLEHSSHSLDAVQVFTQMLDDYDLDAVICEPPNFYSQKFCSTLTNFAPRPAIYICCPELRVSFCRPCPRQSATYHWRFHPGFQ